MAQTYDFVVAGGSIAGLTFAAEAAKRGARVLVAEEHPEIGEPEKCDGLVSLRGLRKFGYPPAAEVVQDRLTSIQIHTPSDRKFRVDANALEVVVLDRSAFDKQVARTAESNGAEIMTGSRVGAVAPVAGGVDVSVGDGSVRGSYFVDATGPSSSPRRGILPAAKYELEADWVTPGEVEVFLDAERYPGFFAWIIPYGKRLAKVGAAGRGVSPFRALDGFLSGRYFKVLRRVSAPIFVGGPTPRFVEGRRIFVGESAGQVKPTTAGGIMTSIAGATVAAKWACAALSKGEPGLVSRYQAEWEGTFLKEMKSMLRLRGVLEKLSNADFEALSSLATPRLIQKLSHGDFDFHATAIFGALSVQGLLKVEKVVASAEVRSILVDG